ncbi:MAG TPA: hypothetical protein VMV49_01855 [Candidatus Deferrimicrobium sp.]|nr:hypothetical protein [Candidatus Deferrimicrobium sp.]
MDIEAFIDSGGLSIVLLIAGTLFAVQAVITFLLWRKGDESYFLKFISYAIAAGAILGIGIGISIALADGGGGLLSGVFIFEILAAITIGIQIYIFIRDNWLSKENKG